MLNKFLTALCSVTDPRVLYFGHVLPATAHCSNLVSNSSFTVSGLLKLRESVSWSPHNPIPYVTVPIIIWIILNKGIYACTPK